MNLSIGEASRLTGLPVKTIRYYSEIGLVPEAGRSSSGYRRYDDAGLARLELVRALRDLGLDLASIRHVAARRASLEDVAAAHAEAIDVHIRQLRLRRAVLREIARGTSRPEEVQRMTAFARASADEIQRIMEEFIASVFAEHEDNPFATTMRAGLPTLPDDPSSAQVDAWIELAGLVTDSDFRRRVRVMVVEGERQRAASGIEATDARTQQAGAAVAEKAGAALAAGIAPDSRQAAAIVAEVIDMFALAAERKNDTTYRKELLAQLETFSDGRVERYWQLVGIINRWPARPALIPAYEWFIAALKAQD